MGPLTGSNNLLGTRPRDQDQRWRGIHRGGGEQTAGFPLSPDGAVACVHQEREDTGPWTEEHCWRDWELDVQLSEGGFQMEKEKKPVLGREPAYAEEWIHHRPC